MKQVLLVGAGNLGKRHLQSLKSSDFDLGITVVEPSVEAAEAARSAFNATELVGGAKELKFVKAINQVDVEPDVAIIATPATGRLELLSEVLRQGARFVVLEKVAFNSVLDIDEAVALVNDSRAKVWVNCPRRLNPIYQSLRNELAGAGLKRLEVSGTNFGLACNFVHFIDLFAYLTGEAEYEVSLLGIERVEPSKRSSYIEFGGSASGEFRSGLPFEMECELSDAAGISVQVRIMTDAGDVLIDEVGGEISYLNSAGNVENRVPYQQPFQSQLTGPLVDELLSDGACGLTPFDESMALHYPYIDAAYSLYASKFGSNSRKMVPVT